MFSQVRIKVNKTEIFNFFSLSCSLNKASPISNLFIFKNTQLSFLYKIRYMYMIPLSLKHNKKIYCSNLLFIHWMPSILSILSYLKYFFLEALHDKLHFSTHLLPFKGYSSAGTVLNSLWNLSYFDLRRKGEWSYK